MASNKDRDANSSSARGGRNVSKSLRTCVGRDCIESNEAPAPTTTISTLESALHGLDIHKVDSSPIVLEKSIKDLS